MLFTNKDILKLAVPCGIQLCAGTGGNADFRRDPARPQHGCNGRLGGHDSRLGRPCYAVCVALFQRKMAGGVR